MTVCTLIPYKFSRRLRHLEAIFIFFISLAIFTLGLGNHEFVEFESRFGLFAQEMLRNGISFFPTAYGEYYPDYPATQTILTYLFSLPFKQVTIFTAVLPTALASACTLMFVYLIGSLQSRRWGLYGVLFTFFTYYFLFSARTITLDQFVTTVTVICFYCCYAAQIRQQTKYLKWLPFLWLLGFLFRGPIGLVIPASVTIAYFLLERNFKAFTAASITALLLLIISMLGLLGIAWYQGGDELFHSVLKMQLAGRIKNTNPVPIYEYFIMGLTSYALTFPIACLVIASHTKRFLQNNVSLTPTLHLLRHLTLYFLIILLGMSIPNAKKIRYILPLVPAIALIAAYIFIDLTPTRLMHYLRRFINQLSTTLPFIGLFLLLTAWIISKKQAQPFEIYYLTAAFSFTALSCLTIIVRKKIKNNLTKELINVSGGVMTFAMIYILMVQPVDIQFNRAKPFVAQVEAVKQTQQQIVFYDFNPDGSLIKFMVALDRPFKPQILHSPTELQNFKAPAIFIAEKKDFDQLNPNVKNQFSVLFEGNLGHTRCVAFSKKRGSHP